MAPVSHVTTAVSQAEPQDLLEATRTYWNAHIHDLAITKSPPGSRAFFDELAAYRFEKLDYLPRVVDFSAYTGKRLLEVGCGVGIDLVRFAAQGAIVSGVDLAEQSIRLALQNFAQRGLRGDLRIMPGEALAFRDESFDVVYAYGVLQFTSDPVRMIHEIQRVLRPGGEAILMVYNRYSWLNLLSMLFGVPLEHADAPVFKKFSIHEFRHLLHGFSRVTIIPERFPVKTRLHRGLKAAVYNGAFVSTFNLLPRALVRPFGWHLMARAFK